MSTQVQTTKQFSLIPQTIDEALQIAERFAQSGMVPKLYAKSADNPFAANRILVAWDYGASLGLGLMASLQGIAVINGMPQVWGDTSLAVVIGSGQLEDIQEKITGSYQQQTLKAICTVKRKGKAERTVEFTFEQAKRAGLIGKSGPWSLYPERMMQMRARNFLLRDVFPDVFKGLQIAEFANESEYTPPYPDAVDATAENVQPQSFTAALEQQQPNSLKTNIVDGVDQATGEAVDDSANFKINPAAQAAAQENFDV